jgi:hypothetical protein
VSVLVHYFALHSASKFPLCFYLRISKISPRVLCTCAFHPIADDDGEPESVHAHLHRGADARASRHAHSLLLQHVLLTADAQSAPRLAADLLRGRSLPVKDVKRALTRPLALPEPTTAAVASGHAEAQRHMVAGAALPRLPADSSVSAAAAASGGLAGFGAQSTYKHPSQQQSQSQSNLSGGGGSDNGSATATTSERIAIEREPREIRPHVMRALSFVQPPPPFQPLARFAPAAAAVPFHSQLQQQHQQFQQQHHHHHTSAHASAQPPPPPPPPNAFIASLCDAPIAQQQTLVVALLHMGRTAAALAPPPPPPPPIVFRRIIGGGASASASGSGSGSGSGSDSGDASSSAALKSPRFVSSPPPSAIIAAAAAPLTAEDAVSDSMALAVASALRYGAPDAVQSCDPTNCESE